VFYSGTLLLQ
jgi:hypothetical protein